jgi:hypothetical protein
MHYSCKALHRETQIPSKASPARYRLQVGID